jgi:hypothetical protein
MNKNGTPNFGRFPLWKLSAIGLVIAATMVISACEAITNGDTSAAGSSNALSLAASRTGVGAVIPINDADELALIGNDPAYPANGEYELGASFAVEDWIPLCGPTATGPFTGTFDGKDKTITISSFDGDVLTSGKYLGIFAASDGASIYDLKVDIDAGIVATTAATNVGGLVGEATGTIFDTITVTGTFNLASSTGTTDAFNAGLVAGSAQPDSTFINTTIKACLNVLYTNTDKENGHNDVNVGAIVGSIVGGKLDQAKVDGQITVKADMPYYADYSVTPPVHNWLAVAGVAGYAENLGFKQVTIDASTAVDAVSQQTTTYVGGVVGRGQSVEITDAVSNAVITGEGPQYDTSGGGVAGYILQSTVENSSASGDIALSATWDGGEYNTWQIYAGGLVGYSGGTANGNSAIVHSYATGAVIAESVYPYAGGLVGYNYGYNDFSSPKAALRYYRYHDVSGVTAISNGSTITRSYAKGSVSAIATPGSGGLPYAGGLAGYSSIPPTTGSNIENSYATGSVTATSDGQYAWAGGLLGANAQGSIVETSYARGPVSVTTGTRDLPYPQPGINPGAAGGGIAGVNYFDPQSTTAIAPLITRSVALNVEIVGSSQDTSLSPYLLHRVVGDLGLGFGLLTNNYGDDKMIILPVWNPVIGPNNVDGDNCALQPPQNFYTAAPLNWNFGSIWTMGSDGYPALQ